MKLKEILEHINGDYRFLGEAKAKKRGGVSQSNRQKPIDALRRFGETGIINIVPSGSIDALDGAKFIQKLVDRNKSHSGTYELRDQKSFMSIADQLFNANYINKLTNHTGAPARDTMLKFLIPFIVDEVGKVFNPNTLFKQKPPTNWEAVEKSLYEFLTTNEVVTNAYSKEVGRSDKMGGEYDYKSMTDVVDGVELGRFFARYATEKLAENYSSPNGGIPTDPYKVVQHGLRIRDRLLGFGTEIEDKINNPVKDSILNALTVDPRITQDRDIETALMNSGIPRTLWDNTAEGSGDPNNPEG